MCVQHEKKCQTRQVWKVVIAQHNEHFLQVQLEAAIAGHLECAKGYAKYTHGM